MTLCAARQICNDKPLPNIKHPVVRIRYGSTVLRSSVKHNDCAPEWNETFRFPVDNDGKGVEVELWDHTVYGEDLLGKYVFYPSERVRGVVSDDWYVLSHNKSHGEVRLRILAVEIGIPPEKLQMWMLTDDITKDPVQQLALAGLKTPDPEVVAAAATDKDDLQKDSQVSPIPISYIIYAQAPEAGAKYAASPAPTYLAPQKGCYQVPNAHIVAAQEAEPELVYSAQAIQVRNNAYIGNPPMPSQYPKHPGFRY